MNDGSLAMVDPHSASCPICGALRGERCFDEVDTKEPLSEPHAERATAASPKGDVVGSAHIRRGGAPPAR